MKLSNVSGFSFCKRFGYQCHLKVPYAHEKRVVSWLGISKIDGVGPRVSSFSCGHIVLDCPFLISLHIVAFGILFMSFIMLYIICFIISEIPLSRTHSWILIVVSWWHLLVCC